MKKYLFVILLLLLTNYSFSQSTSILYVRFDSQIKFNNQNSYKETLQLYQPKFSFIFEKYNLELVKGLPISEEKMDYLSKQSIQLIGNDNSINKLRNIFIINSILTEAQLLQLSIDLERLPEVSYCSFSEKLAVPPPYDIAPTTPNFISNQTYLNSNPGVNMTYAWNLGYFGQNIKVRDVEYGFNKNHEEFNDINIVLAPGMTVHPDCTIAYTEHGTATMGVVFAQNSSYGVTGLAHGLSDVVLFPEWTVEFGYNRNYTVGQAINLCNRGDLLVLEMQAYGATGSGNDFVPAEYNAVLWDLTKAATDAGIVVVAAAGNGNQNLDDSQYSAYMSKGNSGAIIVGAGSSNVNHSRESYSTYGSRVDIQGWGNAVYTSGYIVLPSLGNDFNQTYSNFSGTSSATALISGCVAVLQSYYFSHTNNYLTGPQINQILKSTGLPQGTSVSGNIGPLPNMENAINYVDTILDVEQIGIDNFCLYPNPATDNLFLLFSNPQKFDSQIEIFNTKGQLVLSEQLNIDNSINISRINPGFYFLNLKEGNRVIHKKFLKK